VELGGSDQRFNLLVGRDIQRAYGVAPQCIMTTPILEGLDGVQKMSKSLDNYIGVEDSPREMFGKTMRVSDELMLKYYELLSDISISDLAQMKKDLGDGKLHPKKVKVNLAKFLVKRFHSAEAADQAEVEFERIFVDKGLPDEIPEMKIAAANEVWVCHLLVQLKLAPSTSEARRLIQGKAVEIAQEKVLDPNLKLSLKKGDEMIIKAGKKKFAKVTVE
jgi:tyrosyl-tRNA synthetase